MWVVVAFISTFLTMFLAIRIINYLQLNNYAVSLSRPLGEHCFKITVAVTIGLVCQIAFILLDSFLFSILGFLAQIIPIVAVVAWDMFEEHKTPLVVTKRIVRLYIILAVITFLVSICLSFLSQKYLKSASVLNAIVFLATPLLVVFAKFIAEPIEKLIKHRYIIKSKKVLDSKNDLIKIAITGSYGKTSVKNCLQAILSEKFSVVASPSSYNTPMGLVKTVKLLKDDTQIMIMEMGARKSGDIKELCDIFKPTIGILTGIAPQHLESFKTIENIVNTKYALIESLPKDGFAIFNGQNEWVTRLYLRNADALKILVKTNEGALRAKILKTSKEGSNFILYYNENQIECTTKLIGEHNIENIMLAVSVGVKLGMSLTEISNGISKIEQSPHRLEIINNSNGITIIDDSYNCNVVGAKMALDTIKLFDGRKIVATQGIVELGEEEERENYHLGVNISAVADLVIVIGRRGLIIKKGLLDSGYNPTKILTVDTLKEASAMFTQLLKMGDNLLIMNDLPDNY